MMTKRILSFTSFIFIYFFLAVILYCVIILPYARGSESPSFQDKKYIEPNNITQIKLDSGKKLFLTGKFEVRSILWGEHSIIYYARSNFKVLDVGRSSSWTLHKNSFKSWSRLSGPSLSAKGKTCFLWLDIKEQLTAFDVASGKRKSLTKLPSHIWNYKGDKHLDPQPVWRDRGIVHDLEQNRLIFLIQEESNKDVAFWQRRSSRGGYQIAAVNPDTSKMTFLSGTNKLKGKAYSWDMSLKRKEMYILVLKDEQLVLEVRALDGQLKRTMPLPEEGAVSLQLSPDEKMLLVEKRRDIRRRGEILGGGFVLIDLKTNRKIDGPSSGYCGAWSPDGQIVAYLDNWQLWFYDVAKRTNALIAFRESTGSTPESTPPYWERPVWSSDSKMLAVNIGGDYIKNTNQLDAPTLIIDLQRQYAMIFQDYARDICWIPNPRPFRNK